MLAHTCTLVSRHRYWLVLLAGILLLGQALYLHVHVFADHLVSADHTHPAEVHSHILPMTDDAHDDGANAEPGITQAIVKLLGGALLILPLLALLLLVAPARRRIGHRDARFVWPASPPLLRPPLRAPPR